MEHRCGKRSTLDMPVSLHLGSGSVVEGRMVNLSLSGALASLEGAIPPLSRVVVEIDSEELRRARMHLVPGYVVREAAEGVGIEWAEFAPPTVVVLLSGSAARLPADATLHPAQNTRGSPDSVYDGVFTELPGHRVHLQALRGVGAHSTVRTSQPGSYRE